MNEWPTYGFAHTHQPVIGLLLIHPVLTTDASVAARCTYIDAVDLPFSLFAVGSCLSAFLHTRTLVVRARTWTDSLSIPDLTAVQGR